MSQTIDAGRMFSAINDNADIRDTGYIHRRTGEIVFVYGRERDVAIYMGDDWVAETALYYPTAAASPDEWIEIPKYHGCRAGADDFVAGFLSEHDFGSWSFC